MAHRCLALTTLILLALAGAHARVLLEGSSCSAAADKWSYATSCANVTYGGGYPTYPTPSYAPGGITGPSSYAVAVPTAPALESAPGIGLRTGGAQDVGSFRENIRQGYLPLPTDMTFEGLISEYYFDTSSNNSEPCTDLFCPTYSAAVVTDPLANVDNQTDLFIAVGLDSGLTADDAKRKKLNLVILLDVSGSMGSPFNQYYYDSFGVQQEVPEEERSATKMDVAKEVLSGVLGKLAPEDKVGIVLFTDGACAPKGFGPVSCADIPALQRAVEADIQPLGSTNLQAGLDMASGMLKDCRECMEAPLTEYENRVLLITDAQPNTGDFTTEGLNARMKANAVDNIFLTLIGVGLDFNTELVEAISKVKGANYLSVQTPGAFRKRVEEEFDYLVTPLVFDLSLKIADDSLAADGGEGWKILAVYGSANPNDTALNSLGTIMKINTLFPSPQTEEGIKGGVVLLRMKPPAAANTPLVLTATYTDRAGATATSNRTVGTPTSLGLGAAEGGADQFGSSGVRKAVALAREADLIKTWLLDQWALVDSGPGPFIILPLEDCQALPDYCALPVASTYGVTPEGDGCTLEHWLVPHGCILPPPPIVYPPLLGRWERQSQPLAVSAQAAAAMAEFLPYLEGEVAALGDESMQQEVDTLKTLIALGEDGEA